MPHKIMAFAVALAAVLAFACVSFLLMNPLERESFFLTKHLGKALFPKLARDQRQKRLAFMAGTILTIILLGAFLEFLFKHLAKQ